MAKPKVFVSRNIPANGLDKLKAIADVDVWPGTMPPPRDELMAKIAGCDAILSMLSDKIDGEAMDAAGPSLKVVSNFAVGYNNIDVAAAEKRGIKVGNTPDVLTAATADTAVALLLAAARRVKEGVDQVRDGLWKTWDPTGLLGVELQGKTLGIVGMGRIGQATAKRLAGGWDMNVIYTSRSDKPEADQTLGAKRVSLDQLLQQSDFVSIHTDLNESTNRMFSTDAFEKMQSHAIIVNTSRGDLIDQDALVVALQNGQIRAAGLDVTSPEPLSKDHPLVSLPNCTIIPHVGSATDQARRDMSDIAADNVIAGINGTPLRCDVTA